MLLFGDASYISCPPPWNKVSLEEEGARGVISPNGGPGLAPEKIFKLQMLAGDFLEHFRQETEHINESCSSMQVT